MKQQKETEAKGSQSESITPRNTGAVRQTTDEERHSMIAEAAYYRALARGFEGGETIEDWLAAEREIDGLLLRAPEGSDIAAREGSAEAVLGQRAKPAVDTKRPSQR